MVSGEQLQKDDLIADRFKIVGLLGQGGMGQVYEACQINLSRTIALKVLLPEISEKPGSKERFQREAKVAAALSHPGALRIIDFGQQDDLLFIAMEKIDGPTLRQLLGSQKQPLRPLKKVFEIALQVIDVFISAHEIGLVHRDLKPSNIFLARTESGEERIVVADFGLAFISDNHDTGRLTKEGLLTGTPLYISPEQAVGREVGPMTDMYSFGCLLYEMVTGDVPFRGESDVVVVTKHMFSHPKKMGDRCRDIDIPIKLEDLVLHLLAKRPEERPHPAQVFARLKELLDDLGKSERSRGKARLLVRDQRMIPEPKPLLDAQTMAPENQRPQQQRLEGTPTACLAVTSPLDEILERGLAANGISIFRKNTDEKADALFAPRASIDQLNIYTELDLPLIADSEPSDISRITTLLEIGIDEVVSRPVKVEDLARRIHRAIKRFRGRRRSV